MSEGKTQQKPERRMPKFKIVTGTKAHGSLDTFVADMVADKIEKLGFDCGKDSGFLGYFSFETLPNGDVFLIKHERSGAWINVFNPSRRVADQMHKNIRLGLYPEKTKGQITAHKHTARGTLIGYDGMDIINAACWVGFIPYPKARTNMASWQPDIGGWILLIMKDGRTIWQKWIYRPYIWEEYKNKLSMTKKTGRSYVDAKNFEVSSHFKYLLENAVYKIIIIADTHIGEKVAPCPEEFATKGRMEQVSLCKANRLMNAYWYHFMYMTKYVFKADEIWHLGDVVAGTNPFEKYRAPLMTNLTIEADAFVGLMNAYNYDAKTLRKLVKRNLTLAFKKEE